MSDISSAFDRVFRPFLLGRLSEIGFSDDVINIFDAYLQPRTCNIVVNGEKSDDMDIDNSVFQGSVLGPSPMAFVLR